MEDADFINVVGLWWRSRAQIRRAHYEGFTRIFGGSAMDVREVTVRLLSTEAALVRCAWTLTGQDPHGDHAAGERRGIISFAAALIPDQGWRAVAAQNTDHINGAETLVATGDALEGANYMRRGADPREL